MEDQVLALLAQLQQECNECMEWCPQTAKRTDVVMDTFREVEKWCQQAEKGLLVEENDQEEDDMRQQVNQPSGPKPKLQTLNQPKQSGEATTDDSCSCTPDGKQVPSAIAISTPHKHTRRPTTDKLLSIEMYEEIIALKLQVAQTNHQMAQLVASVHKHQSVSQRALHKQLKQWKRLCSELVTDRNHLLRELAMERNKNKGNSDNTNNLALVHATATPVSRELQSRENPSDSNSNSEAEATAKSETQPDLIGARQTNNEIDNGQLVNTTTARTTLSPAESKPKPKPDLQPPKQVQNTSEPSEEVNAVDPKRTLQINFRTYYLAKANRKLVSS